MEVWRAPTEDTATANATRDQAIEVRLDRLIRRTGRFRTVGEFLLLTSLGVVTGVRLLDDHNVLLQSAYICTMHACMFTAGMGAGMVFEACAAEYESSERLQEFLGRRRAQMLAAGLGSSAFQFLRVLYSMLPHGIVDPDDTFSVVSSLVTGCVLGWILTVICLITLLKRE